MKIFYVTDIHFRSFVFDWIQEQQNIYDAIRLTEDFLDETCDTDVINQITWVTN